MKQVMGFSKLKIYFFIFIISLSNLQLHSVEIAQSTCLDYLKFGFFVSVSSEDFHQVVSTLEGKPFLRKRSLQEYQSITSEGGRLFLLSDKSAGYGIRSDGLLISVFKNGGPKGLGSAVVKDAIIKGAHSLICADGPLKDFYESLGFEVTTRFKMSPENAGYNLLWENDIRPDMLFMELKKIPDISP